VGDDPHWVRMEAEVPGFLDLLLRPSPEGFEAFFVYCAVPWKTRALRARTKELISLAVDSTRARRYLPGMRLHIAHAINLGAGKTTILQAPTSQPRRRFIEAGAEARMSTFGLTSPPHLCQRTG
jgi:alkylhydroperoxidase/carboxymuconolactone decarboxylase family protein YurZ